ncbi:MAG TPA: endonuclease V, partial [Thermoplasmatales archaeon]|nr:endonuclease V [Thermoplasmatales archaeon]
ELREKVVTEDDFEMGSIAAMDVSYTKRFAYGAYVEFDEEGNLVKKKVAKMKIEFPYIPTYLAYRELPVLNELMKDEKPSIVMLDGNGLLHPRLFGIACHFGVLHDIATIGIAKKLLCGMEKDGYVFIGRRKVARRLGKIFVSPGNKISVDSAYKIAKKFMKYSIPEPVRQAHMLANEARRKDETGNQ